MKTKWKSWIGTVAVCAMSQVAHAGTVWSVNGHEYDVIAAEEITWTNARTAALALGSGWDLATITSADEHVFVSSLLPLSPTSRSHYWLGATDEIAEGTFVWVTGEVFSYSNWWSGEPNNLRDEDYLAYDFREGWKWNDAPSNLGSWARGYVAERIAEGTVPETGVLSLLGLGLILLGFQTRRQAQRSNPALPSAS